MSPSIQTTGRLPVAFHEYLEARFQGEFELPLLPEAAAQVVALCEDDDADARDLERALERDPSLASHILRISNSAAYAPKEPIVSLQQAVSRLGMATVRNLALSVSLHGKVFQVPGHEQVVKEVWGHCAVAAAFAREIARKLRLNVEGAFLCALLHDVGRPIVLQAALEAPPEHAAGPGGELLFELAMDEFHERVGARLVETWGLADWTAAAVAHHHQPDQAEPHEQLARVVRLADLLSHWALSADAGPEAFAATDPVVQALNLYPEDIAAFLALREKMLAAAEAFQ